MFESPCAVEAQLSFLSQKRNCVCDPDDWAPILAPLIYTGLCSPLWEGGLLLSIVLWPSSMPGVFHAWNSWSLTKLLESCAPSRIWGETSPSSSSMTCWGLLTAQTHHTIILCPPISPSGRVSARPFYVGFDCFPVTGNLALQTFALLV